MLGREEVAVNRMVLVQTDTAVNVNRSVPDTVSRICSPELGRLYKRRRKEVLRSDATRQPTESDGHP